MEGVDCRRVRRSFQRGAVEYDQHTPVQQRVVAQLLERIAAQGKVEQGALLDIGCGTGRLLAGVMEQNPHCLPVGLDLAGSMLGQARARTGDKALLVQAAAEQLPFQNQSFNLVVSSSTFQWCAALESCFGEVHRCLQQNGRFFFALFGDGTFHELKDSWREARLSCGFDPESASDGTHRFHSAEQVRAALENRQFRNLSVAATVEKEWYPDVAHLLQSVKRIGAGSSRPPAGGGLGWRRVLHRMAEIYADKYGTPRGVPASYQIIWGTGVR